MKWAYDDFWAPEIHFVNSHYYVYYSARSIYNNKLCIGVAISSNNSNPFGPYEELDRPIIEHPDGVIDITWFQDPRYIISSTLHSFIKIIRIVGHNHKTNISICLHRDMKTYLIWKRDSNAENRQSSIHLRQVEKDGVTFRNDWETITLVTANYTTERRVVEGPWMIYRYLAWNSLV